MRWFRRPGGPAQLPRCVSADPIAAALCLFCGYYRKRHRVENFFQRIKALRRLATRYDKTASCFFAFAFLASILDWLRSF
ncbi:MAG: transposase [Verrucomicrobia bacterium]|nr:transposase [Verrucomicrobiota bacterium]